MKFGLSARGPFGLTCRRCLHMGWLPTLLAAVLAFTLHLTIAPALGEQHAPGAASPWLVFPMVVASLTCAVTAAVFWPTFARGLEKDEVIHRAGQQGQHHHQQQCRRDDLQTAELHDPGLGQVALCDQDLHR